MYRLISRLAVAFSAIGAAFPALAADYGYDNSFRPAYPDDWQPIADEEPLGFEFGLRYWYSWGEDKWSVGGDDFNSTDRTQTGELHLRIDDYTTQSYVKGLAGYSMVINGEYDNPLGSGSITDGRVGYAGADFGWSPFGWAPGNNGIFGLVGYQYWNESPNMGRANFTTAETSSDVGWTTGSPTFTLPFDSQPDNIDIHALRLGISGKAELSDMFDISAEVAAVPYAWVNGTLGAAGVDPVFSPGATTYQSSPVSVNGFGYGAMGELMLGIHPMENMAIRVGGRAWYLQGQVDASFNTATVTDPIDTDGDGTLDGAPSVSQQGYVSTSNPFSLFRYGLLAELTYKF